MFLSDGEEIVQRLIFDVHEEVVKSSDFERRSALKHFKEKDAQTPNISLEGLSLPLKNFGCHVLIGSAKGLPVDSLFTFNRPSKITEFHIQLLIQ